MAPVAAGDEGRHGLGEERRQQEPVPIGAVDADEPAAGLDLHARHVVDKGGPDAGAHVEDLRFREGWVQRIRRAQQFERRAHRHGAVVLALDHRRTDDEAPVALRHDINRLARMQKTHRAGERDFARAHDQALAAHTAQTRQALLRAKASGSRSTMPSADPSHEFRTATSAPASRAACSSAFNATMQSKCASSG